jgi:hypothetical protein
MRRTGKRSRGLAGDGPVRRPAIEMLEPRLLLDGNVVINEIHYDPDLKTQPAEFIELYNKGNSAINMSGWYFSNGLTYTFPTNTIIGAHAYLVVAENPTFCKTKFGMAATPLGPFTGTLSNEGEQITLRNASGGKEDSVDYKGGFPWPTVGDTPGYSIELINPSFDNDLGGNWRRSALDNTGALALVAGGSTWDVRKGTSEPSSPVSAWRGRTFVEDGTWTPGAASVGFGESFINTTLADMQNNYTTYYLRQTLTINNPAIFTSLRLEAQFADGFIAWINGTMVASSNVASTELPYTGTAVAIRENFSYATFTLPTPSSAYLVSGTNVLAVQVLTADKTASMSAFFDARLLTDRRPGPTPGMVNAVFDTNAPPAIRQVDNTPVQPLASQPVTLTAKITDPSGVTSVKLEYQTVDPGSYIAIADAAYQNGWTQVTMNDAGTNGDATAGDNIYTVVLPAPVQMNRRLVRYRITATDGLGASVRVPYVDDPQPNFAYYVYNGVPAYTAAVQPGVTSPVTYPAGVMGSLPYYTLLSKQADVEDSTWHSQYGGNLYQWSGTLVYDGVVYDGVHYRARGGVWRYSMGKNMWKFDFNRGHEFQARDNYGNPYAVKWNKLNLGACIQQGDYWHRGEQGMFESVGFALFNLAGVAASTTSFVTFRVVDNASEAGNTQYDGDFWGLYLVTEQVGGTFLDQHDLPDGNLYKMESGAGGGELQNQGPTQVTDNSDLVTFTNTYRNTTPTAQWWNDNLNLTEYYSYRSIVEGIHHGDIGYGKNYFYLHNPETNKWEVYPWDLDLTWADNMYGDGNSPFKTKVANTLPMSIDYRNRLREVRDLLYNTDQVYQLIDEMQQFIYTPGQLSMIDADRAMWDYNPIMISSYVNQSKAGQGRFYQGGGGQVIPPPGGFPGMVQKMKNYVVTRAALMDTLSADVDGTGKSYVPARPTVTSTGPANYPINQLSFRSSAFVKSANGTDSFAAMQWRIAEVTDPNGPYYDPAAPKLYEINAAWQSAEIATFTPDVVIPSNVVQTGHTYRVRVRMKNSLGRWTDWADPIQFVAGSPAGTAPDTLRITELQYHPAPPPQGSPFIEDDFEYIELQNTGAASIDLTAVRFTDGITFTFPTVNLGAGQYVLVVKNQPAFESRYGTGKNIAGTFTTGVLSDDGEHLQLEYYGGQALQSFTYKDGWYPQTDGDGYSLTVCDPAQALALWDSKDGWRSSHLVGGSPGTFDVDFNPGSVPINELLAHTNADPRKDWVELKNTTTQPINVGGWFLSDSAGDLRKYRIATGTTIQPGQYLLLTQRDNFGNPADPGYRTAFGYGEDGGTVYLTSADAAGNFFGYREIQDFNTSEREVAFTRYVKSTGGVDFVAEREPTPGADNAYPKVGPIVINEIMYAPAAAGDEFIELKNLTGDAVTLYDLAFLEDTWKFTSGIAYTFPMGKSVPANGLALVVGIDPGQFRAKYGVPAAVPIFGSFAGLLDDTGASVELQKPEYGEQDIPAITYYRADRVTYGVAAPWPTSPAGTGPSLQRLFATDYGNDVANWAAGPAGGTPGLANGSDDVLPPRLIDVSTRDGDATHVTVVFDEVVDPVSSRLAANYAITNVTVSSVAAGADNRTVVLTTSPLVEGVLYSLTVNHVKDVAGNEILPDSRRTFVYYQVGTGLWGQYYQYSPGNITWTNPRISRLDATVDFDWGTSYPNATMSIDYFSIRWSGKIKGLFSETYTFYTWSDEGVKLWVNGQLVIDDWTPHAAVEDSGTFTMVAGTRYDIKMEYYEGTGAAAARLSWSSPHTSKQIIPTSLLFNVAVPAVTQPDSYLTPAGVALNAAAPGVLANDLDPNGLPLTAVLRLRVSHGTLTLRPDGSFTYTPTAGYDGSDSFSYYANNGWINSGETTVSLLVDRPVYVSSVMLNDVSGRTVSGIDPSGGGVQSVKVTFSKAVTFAPEDVVVQAVTFNGTSETAATLTSLSVAGSGSNLMTIGFAPGAVVDTWVKVTLKGSGTLQGTTGAHYRLDGEPKAGGSGRSYVYAASDLPTGNGTEGGDAVFYVGNLRGDFASVGGAPTPDGQVSDADVAGFLAKFQAADKDADFRGSGFAPSGPDGQVTPFDFDGFMSIYQQAVAEGRRLAVLPNPGPQGGSDPGPLGGSSAPDPVPPAAALLEQAASVAVAPDQPAAAAPLAAGAPDPVMLAAAAAAAPSAPADMSRGDVAVAPYRSGLPSGPRLACKPCSLNLAPGTAHGLPAPRGTRQSGTLYRPVAPVAALTLDIEAAEVPLAFGNPPAPALRDGPALASDGGQVDLLALPALELPLAVQ